MIQFQTVKEKNEVINISNIHLGSESQMSAMFAVQLSPLLPVFKILLQIETISRDTLDEAMTFPLNVYDRFMPSSGRQISQNLVGITGFRYAYI